MITVRVEGGLGNQLFMYAMGRALALRSGMPLRLDSHNGQYGPTEPFGRSFLLDRFRIAATLASPQEVGRYDRDGRPLRVARRVSRLLPVSWRSVLQEASGGFTQTGRPTMHRSTYLIGYWQDERYFLDAGVRIAEELDPSTPMRTSVLEQAKLLESDTAFVHLRRTRFPYLLPVDYYTNAMGLMRDLYKVRRFIIFGDDPQWAHEHLARYGDVNIHEPGRTSDVEDLWLMSNFRFGIVANSSFSWWSAWKAKMREPTRPMICPDTWGFPTRPSASWIQLRAKLDYRVIPPLGTGLIGCRV